MVLNLMIYPVIFFFLVSISIALRYHPCIQDPQVTTTGLASARQFMFLSAPAAQLFVIEECEY